MQGHASTFKNGLRSDMVDLERDWLLTDIGGKCIAQAKWRRSTNPRYPCYIFGVSNK